MKAHAIELDRVTKIYRRYSGRQFATLKSALLQRSILRDLAAAETFPALTDVSFSVPKGSTYGVIGRNGSGKSTALKLVAGITKPTSGTVKVEGRISALIELGAGFHPEISGRENVFINGIMLGLSKAQIQDRFDEIVDFAELREFIDAPVKTYSSGMYMRLGFAVADIGQPHAAGQVAARRIGQPVADAVAVGQAASGQHVNQQRARRRLQPGGQLAGVHPLGAGQLGRGGRAVVAQPVAGGRRRQLGRGQLGAASQAHGQQGNQRKPAHGDAPVQTNNKHSAWAKARALPIRLSSGGRAKWSDRLSDTPAPDRGRQARGDTPS